jgi:hypothetical protein
LTANHAKNHCHLDICERLSEPKGTEPHIGSAQRAGGSPAPHPQNPAGQKCAVQVVAAAGKKVATSTKAVAKNHRKAHFYPGYSRGRHFAAMTSCGLQSVYRLRTDVALKIKFDT